jgi:hypothetical protein
VKLIIYIMVSIFLLWAAFVAGYNAKQPTERKLACIHPMNYLGCDTPSLRMYLTYVNENACFLYKASDRPDVVGLNDKDYDMWEWD